MPTFRDRVLSHCGHSSRTVWAVRPCETDDLDRSSQGPVIPDGEPSRVVLSLLPAGRRAVRGIVQLLPHLGSMLTATRLTETSGLSLVPW